MASLVFWNEQKPLAASAVLKHSNHSQDVAKVKQFPKHMDRAGNVWEEVWINKWLEVCYVDSTDF